MCLFGMFVLCPPTWRINTYIKAIAHMLRFCHSIHVYRSVPAHLLSNCHAVCPRVVKVVRFFFRVGDPVLYMIYCHFCTEYELICSVNTFCTCRHPYYVQKTYKTTYEFHFQLGFSRRVQAVTSSRSSRAARRPAEHSLYLSGVL